MFQKKIILFLSVFGICSLTQAQPPLDSVVIQALALSPDAKILELTTTQQNYQNQLQLASLRPSLSLTSSLPGYTRSINSITQPDGSLKFRTQSQAYSAIGINASQNIAATGGRLSLISGLNRIDLFDPSSSTSWSSNLFILNYSQPLFQYNELRHLRGNVKATQKVQEIEAHKRKKQFEQKIVALVLDYYTQHQKLSLLQNQLTQQKQVLEKTVNLVHAGKVLKEDQELLSLEIAKNSYRLINSKKTVELLLAQVAYHTGKPYKETILSLEIESWPLKKPNKDSLTAQALASPTLLASIEAAEQARQNVARTKQNSGISASLDVSFGYNQRADAFQDIYQNPLDRQMATVSITMPILDGGKTKYSQLLAQNQLAQATLRHTISEQTIPQQVDALMARFDQLQSNITFATQAEDIAVQRATRMKQLYTAGKLTIDQYLNAQNYAYSIKLQLLTARTAYWKLWYSVWF